MHFPKFFKCQQMKKCLLGCCSREDKLQLADKQDRLSFHSAEPMQACPTLAPQFGVGDGPESRAASSSRGQAC